MCVCRRPRWLAVCCIQPATCSYLASKRNAGGKGTVFGTIASQSKRKIDIQAGAEDRHSGGHFVDDS